MRTQSRPRRDNGSIGTGPPILCCPDKFRGSLTAPEAAAAMCHGVQRAGREGRALPLADGGEGTLEAILACSPGALHTLAVTGPDGASVEAAWAALEDGTGVVEMARASGLALVAHNDPLTATTRGTGELIAAAIGRGCQRVIVGVGGSATVDGGLGAIEALGWSLGGVEIVVACDVTTPFLDAPALFGPQKGASPADVRALEERLRGLAERYRQATGVDVSGLAGSGAAGGLAGGLAALGARLVPGFDVVADAVGFDAALAESAAVITGEGKVDRSTLSGKVVARVLEASRRRGLAAAVVAGRVEPGVDLDGVPVLALSELGGDSFGEAAALVEQAAFSLASLAAL
jgi:glycerate kinase